MIKTFGKRLAAMAVVSALCAGVTLTYGIPNIKYKPVKSNEPVMITVDGDPVHQDEYTAYLKYNKSYMESVMAMYGYDADTMWNGESSDMFIQQLFDMADQQAAYLRVVNNEFNQLGLKLSRQAREDAYEDKHISILQIGGQEMFEQWMETNGFTEQIYDNTVAASAYLDAIEDAYYGENGTVVPLADQVAKFNEDYVCAKHVLISSTDDEGNELTGDALTEAQAKANEVLEKAKSGADFDTLIAQYNEDPGMQQYPDGYVFTEGEMVDAFYQGAKALEPGEISPELVKTDFGWHIIQREPLTGEQLMDDANQAIRTQIITELAGKSFDEEMSSKLEAAQIEHTENYGEATYENLMNLIGGETDDTAAAE